MSVMNIEDSLFEKYQVDYDKLIQYGFKLENSKYIYEVVFMNDFKCIIEFNNKISGKLIDLSFNEEYTLFRKEELGLYALGVKNKYEDILIDIRDKCFKKQYFIFDQSNRITKLIYDKYHVKPEFLWKDDPSGVFRNIQSNKWFSIIMKIDRSKIMDSSGYIEIMNVKLNNLDYLKVTGIYEAFHMNKKSWVSIVLNDTLSDLDIMKLIDISYELTKK